jgi:ankyrin repeat protein
MTQILSNRDLDEIAVLDRFRRYNHEFGFSKKRAPFWLQKAASGGHYRVIEFIVQARPDTSNLNLFRALVEAIKNDDEACVNMLIAHGAPLEWEDPLSPHKHAIKHAVENRSVATARILFESGASKDVVCHDQAGLVYWAVTLNDRRMIRMMHSVGVSIEKGSAFRGDTPFLWAVQKGHLEIAHLLVELGANVHTPDISMRNAAHLAANGSCEMMKLVVDAGVQLNVRSGEGGLTPLMIAASHGSTRMVTYLHSVGAHGVNDAQYKWPPLYWVAEQGKAAMYTCLVRLYGVLSTDGITPLHRAVVAGRSQIVRAAIDAGEDLSRRNTTEDATYLHTAAAYNWIDIITMLLNAGVDINAKAKQDTTPLMAAIINERYEAAQVLIQAGAEMNLEDSSGDTALNHAIKQGRLDLVRLVLSNHSTENSLDGSSEGSPLHLAANRGLLAIFKQLLIVGSHTAITNPQLETVGMMALRTGKKDILDLLFIWERDGHFETAEQTAEVVPEFEVNIKVSPMDDPRPRPPPPPRVYEVAPLVRRPPPVHYGPMDTPASPDHP